MNTYDCTHDCKKAMELSRRIYDTTSDDERDEAYRSLAAMHSLPG